MSDTVLVVLMRWPRPGEGKTRLAAEVGSAAAHALHRCFVADTLGWPLPRPRLLAVSPDAAAVAKARAVAPDAHVVLQESGDLGMRIAAALHTAFAGGARCALLVGSDSPSLPHGLAIEAAAAATRTGAALVPATDGGFVALAVAAETARQRGLDWLRAGVAWSTERTTSDARLRARRSGVELALTRPWYDVDTVADLSRLHRDLLRDPRRAPRTLRWLRRSPAAARLERAS